MSDIIKVGDQKQLVETKDYKYAKFPFEKFNVVQSRVFEFFDKEVNASIAAKTSAGKTVCAEMLLAHEVRKRGGKGMYLAPLKALASEKLDDWTDEDHHFRDLNVSICTGDYLLTPQRKKELNDANLIVMSSEMLNSRGRNYKSEHNNWIEQVGTLVVDESHLLTVPGRGDHLESGLMKFSKINPNGRIVLLSATMPNVDQISQWVSHLTKRDTYFLESDYRPCPLETHYCRYDDELGSYDRVEEEKVYRTLEIIDNNPIDKFLVFGHTKRTVEMMYRFLKKSGYECEMHTGDLDKRKRRQVERRFREDDKLRIVVATSTLAWGLNLPARRVIIMGVHRGLSDVPVYDVEQMKGRAGRPQYDPAGDVYILVPRTTMAEQIHRLSQPQKIESQLFNIHNSRCNKVFGFHLVSEIHHKDVESRDEVKDWYDNSLAAFQNKELEDHVVENTLTDLIRCGAVKEENDELRATAIGKIASMFYYSPFDVSDLGRNFNTVFKEGKENDDLWISFALAWTDTYRYTICSNAEKAEIEGYAGRLYKSKAISLNRGWHSDGAIKVGYAYYCCLRGINSQVLSGLIGTLRYDIGRVKQVLQALDALHYRWGRRDYLIELEQKVKLGVPAELVQVCRLDGIARVKGQRLYDHGLKTLEQIAKANKADVVRALGCSGKVAEKIMANAKELLNEKG